MPHYHIWTIGCQMNKAESEKLAGLLEQKGYRPVGTPEKADILVVNSCVVRQSAEDRVVNRLHLLKQIKKQRPGTVLAVTGCFVGTETESLKKNFPHIDHFFGPGDIPAWLDEVKVCETSDRRATVAAYLPIMRGCNNFCSYCIVPFRRGRERSRPMAELVAEGRELVSRGARELTLLGQNVNSYGQDLAGGADLADLLTQMNAIEGLYRLRFLTNHPKDMSTRLIERMASLEEVCEHLNLPVQSGDDAVLESMRRGYTAQHYRRLVQEIRTAVPGIALSTDVIVGYPIESEGAFEHTVDLLKEVRFDTVHVACYSPRTGTPAARQLKDEIPPAEKKRRLSVIEELQEGIATEINRRLIGATVEVLVEGKTKGKWRGRTRSDKLVFFAAPGEYQGRLVRVEIEKTGPWSLQGTVVNPPI